ncbi:MAG: hypothetical protein ACI85I_002880 [Arenicella sp.]|jgi:hypothetical protein
MKKTLLILIGIFSLMDFTNCQSLEASKCDVIYDCPEVLPHYQDDRGLMRFFSNEFVSTISNCMKRDHSMITRFYLTLTINKKGKIEEVDFKKMEASEESRKEIVSKLEEMKWEPGIVNGKPVCSKFNWVMGCIKWG